MAQDLGYQILVADGMPIVVQILARKDVDAIVGVACMDSLEAAFEKVWQLGLPAVAVPLLEGTCKDTSVDLDWVRHYVEGFCANGGATTAPTTARSPPPRRRWAGMPP